MPRHAVFALALAACGTSSDDPIEEPPEGFLVSGSIDIAGAPAGSKLAVIWEVTSGTDALIKFGDAMPRSGAFMLGLASDPPARAINSHGVAVGVLVLFDGAATLPPDGADFDDEALEPHFLGFGDYEEIIWRGDGVGEPPEWAPKFPEGYSCGRCVFAGEDGGHDSFVPTACELSIVADDNVCNWT